VGSACCDLSPKSFRRLVKPISPLIEEQPEIDSARQTAEIVCDLSFINFFRQQQKNKTINLTRKKKQKRRLNEIYAILKNN
jgi:hypothetical protein